jgi:hypothetical protein
MLLGRMYASIICVGICVGALPFVLSFAAMDSWKREAQSELGIPNVSRALQRFLDWVSDPTIQATSVEEVLPARRAFLAQAGALAVTGGSSAPAALPAAGTLAQAPAAAATLNPRTIAVAAEMGRRMTGLAHKFIAANRGEALVRSKGLISTVWKGGVIDVAQINNQSIGDLLRTSDINRVLPRFLPLEQFDAISTDDLATIIHNADEFGVLGTKGELKSSRRAAESLKAYLKEIKEVHGSLPTEKAHGELRTQIMDRVRSSVEAIPDEALGKITDPHVINDLSRLHKKSDPKGERFRKKAQDLLAADPEKGLSVLEGHDIVFKTRITALPHGYRCTFTPRYSIDRKWEDAAAVLKEDLGRVPSRNQSIQQAHAVFLSKILGSIIERGSQVDTQNTRIHLHGDSVTVDTDDRHLGSSFEQYGNDLHDKKMSFRYTKDVLKQLRLVK